MEKVKVLIVDDHTVFCEALASLLTLKGEVDVVGTASNAEDGLKKVKELNPQIVLLDIELNGCTDGIQATHMIKEKFPATEVIMLTMHSNEDYLVDSINAGAKGYISKEFSCSYLLQAIKAVSKGESLVDPRSANKMFREFKKLLNKRENLVPNRSDLSEREVEILRLIAEGNTNKDIGERLHLSINTVRNHVANIFLKLECNSRTKAVFKGRKKQLI